MTYDMTNLSSFALNSVGAQLGISQRFRNRSFDKRQMQQ
jgi:hypothetical protein